MGTTNQALTEAVFYILLALQKPLHGYGIMQETSELSNGRLILSAGTLYGAISTLIDKEKCDICVIATDSFTKKVDEIVAAKEKEIMTV